MNRPAHSRRRIFGYGSLLFAAASASLLFGQGSPAGEQVREDIRRQLELAASSALQEEVLQFYHARDFAPAWTAAADAEALVNRLSQAGDEGLEPQDYRVQELRALLAGRNQGQADNAAADVRLTLAYMQYSRDVRGGRLDPETLDRLWTPAQRQGDLAAELSEALRDRDVDGSLQRAAPAQAGYRQLKQALAGLRRLQEGGFSLPAASMRADAGAPEQPSTLRQRLTVLGDISPGEPDKAGVMRFQRRHGLPESGEADQATMRALNIPLEERIRTIELNLERWRWLPDELGSRYILVNVAAFEARVIESDRTVMCIPAIVGRPYRRTPVFSGLMTYLVFSPYWNVPNNIAVRDKLPLIQKDPEYLAREGFRVFPKAGSDPEALDPAAIDWSALSADNFPYRLRQDPGPLNALGRVKFMFPNKYNVYLHDTPQRELFGETVRTFSSGCIRLERPFDLAQYLLRGAGEWTDEKIRSAMDSQQETTVVLPEPLPVHMVYFTAWVGEDGELNFRDDVYGRDAVLSSALLARDDSGGAALRQP